MQLCVIDKNQHSEDRVQYKFGFITVTSCLLSPEVPKRKKAGRRISLLDISATRLSA